MPGIRPDDNNATLEALPRGFSYLNELTTRDRIGTIAISHPYTTVDPRRVTAGRKIYALRLKELYEWAARNNLALALIHEFRPTLDNAGVRMYLPVRLPDRWYVSHSAATLTDMGYRITTIPADVPCSSPDCDLDVHPYGTVVCPETLEPLYCLSCGREGPCSPRVTVETFDPNRRDYACSTCGIRCSHPGCQTYARGTRYCADHGTSIQCVACLVEYSWRAGETPLAERTADGSWVCTATCSVRICGECRNYSPTDLAFSSHYGSSVCAACRRNQLRLSAETFDDDVQDLQLDRLPVIPGREIIRGCGIEIEGANGSHGANDLAQDLYAAGLSQTNRMLDHGVGTRYGPVHVEYDSSVDWECVIGPLNMALEDDAKVLNGVMKVIRQGIKLGKYKLDLRAGVHIHVAADRISLGQAYNLSHIFTYIEDPFFRMGAAKWPFHRASQGSNYCAPIPKHSRKLDFYTNRGGQGTNRNNHYYALSFANYFNAMMRSCVCGAAGAGLWDECSCDLGKCTFEFRLFNTTANSKKMKAYLALTQALVAKAVALPEIQHPNDDLPGLPFNGRVFKEMSADEKRLLANQWRPRLAYIFSELPLTDDEKEAIIYCIKNCEIAQAMTEDEILELANTPSNVTEAEVAV